MQTIDLIGVFAFGVSGALMAVRRDFDVVGIAILAVVTALGGGIVRDLVLGDTPPPAFTRWEYLVVALAAAAVTAVGHRVFTRLARPLLVFDAAGLGLFCVAGTEKALDHGLAPVAAACLGVTTAVGGGVLRDVIAREVPALVRADSELYALPAVAGALVVGIAPTVDADSTALPGRRRRRLRRPRARPAAPLARSAGTKAAVPGRPAPGGPTPDSLTEREDTKT
ncbi:trimeric intracellular cation channel family protein [Blastococcus haudaquaticus]|uniref:Uncharacterized membrane protein YeiH n=1 Tax=Blastococcus haudaquaticus TaxID=1938745 RepID=A0A286GQ13_9ACTN|nr:trimeric intracellular cation channel family protein [Blastococcus haudaquaticus]SOD97608.1 Uncharacterized membrane protein YeiH [Blastococcus haudaquaticus]